ncbi:phosphatase [uncultured Bifidobacterium sp.]|uniref:phosphatase n=1 Tax=uncultured Bifidobacterium sp. TaxID=165187 RepID=UPI0028DBA255|nr:phosphatase [uncultured Bifidobacterium sp.]
MSCRSDAGSGTVSSQASVVVASNGDGSVEGATGPATETSPLDGGQRRLARDLTLRRIVGDVPTDRSSNINNLRALAGREPHYMFGVDVQDHWDETELLELMHRRVGISADPAFEHGQDRIDPELTVRALARYASAIGETARWRGTFLFATGHPSCLAWIYAPIVRAVRAAGCPVVSLDVLLGSDNPVSGTVLGVEAPEPGQVRQIEGVLMRYDRGNLLHTHEPGFMEKVIGRLDDAGLVPDLVVADHGWAGASGRRGYRTIGIADCNDPALFVAEAQGEVEVCVPMDDGMPPSQLGGLIGFVLDRAGLRDPDAG